MPLPTRGGPHGRLLLVTADVVTFSIAGSAYGVQGYTTNFDMGRTFRRLSDPFNIPAGQELTVPLELIRSVWRDAAEPEFLHFDLDARIEWRNEAWRLGTGEYEVLVPRID